MYFSSECLLYILGKRFNDYFERTTELDDFEQDETNKKFITFMSAGVSEGKKKYIYTCKQRLGLEKSRRSLRAIMVDDRSLIKTNTCLKHVSG